MGERGLGLLESVDSAHWPDVVMGSFSKTFASNGGFVAAPRCVTDYLRYHSSPVVFSNGISPVQTSIVSAACSIVFSDEGHTLRGQLMERVRLLRDEMSARGLSVTGVPSPIVPVYVGQEALARLTSRYLQENGLLANLVEFPAVPKGKARFRFQVMSSHRPSAIVEAAEIMARSREMARTDLGAAALP
jgi:7-keto-8-aminopelargonate synthetase-like enzyme